MNKLFFAIPGVTSVYNWFVPVLPPAIPAEQLLNESCKDVVESLQQRGYCIIRPNKTTIDQLLSMRDNVASFFDLSEEEKKKYMPPASTDPLLKGRRPNRGYCTGKSKEYLKIRLRDESSAYPQQPAELESAFRDAMNSLWELTHAAFLQIANTTIDGTDKPWMDKKTVDNLTPFFPEGSSVSVIKYHAEDSSSEIDHTPLDEHVDTGIVTLIRVGDVPGLHVFDQQRQEWLEIEKIAPINDLLLIMGRKMELLLDRSVKLVPTLHRVVIPKNKERYSMLFFMDVPTGKDT